MKVWGGRRMVLRTIVERQRPTHDTSVPRFKYVLITVSGTNLTSPVSLTEALESLEALRVHNPRTSVSVMAHKV